MSLIPDRYVCSNCSGYDFPWPSNLSSVCRCPGSHKGPPIDDEPTTKGKPDVARTHG